MQANDADPRAHDMFIRSGLSDSQIHHVSGLAFDAQALSLDAKKVQTAALRFHEMPCNVDSHRHFRSPLWKQEPEEPKRMSRYTFVAKYPTEYQDINLGTFLAGDSDRVHRDLLHAETLDVYVEEDHRSDQQLHGAKVGHKEALERPRSESGGPRTVAKRKSRTKAEKAKGSKRKSSSKEVESKTNGDRLEPSQQRFLRPRSK